MHNFLSMLIELGDLPELDQSDLQSSMLDTYIRHNFTSIPEMKTQYQLPPMATAMTHRFTHTSSDTTKANSNVNNGHFSSADKLANKKQTSTHIIENRTVDSNKTCAVFEMVPRENKRMKLDHSTSHGK